jgi:hypothetical protein
MWKLLWSIWLLTLLGIFGGGVPVAASTVWSGSMWFTFHYDGQTQGGPAYDGASPRVLDYDSAAVPIADGKENRTARTGDAFPNFAEFPAAETEVTARPVRRKRILQVLLAARNSGLGTLAPAGNCGPTVADVLGRKAVRGSIGNSRALVQPVGRRSAVQNARKLGHALESRNHQTS